MVLIKRKYIICSLLFFSDFDKLKAFDDRLLLKLFITKFINKRLSKIAKSFNITTVLIMFLNTNLSFIVFFILKVWLNTGLKVYLIFYYVVFFNK